MENEVLYLLLIYELLEKFSIVVYFFIEFFFLGRLVCVGEKDVWIIYVY